jgi:hypothetical protein
MNSNQTDHPAENPPDEKKAVQLPEPDRENITVLTRALPNDPILPWHHYDSPWLEPNGEGEVSREEAPETPDSTAETEAGSEGAIAPDLALEDASPETVPPASEDGEEPDQPQSEAVAASDALDPIAAVPPEPPPQDEDIPHAVNPFPESTGEFLESR